MRKNKLVAAVVATTLLTTGVALAANQETRPQQNTTGPQKAADKDFGKLSVDGSRAFKDLTLTRLAIFDGSVDAAKKYINDADGGFAKAKSDDTVFMKAEADLKPPAKSADAKSASSTSVTSESTPQASQMKTPIAWLPVDSAMSIAEDYSASPVKSAAVADANNSMKAGDKKGAVEKLKLAGMNVDVTLAVLPLNQTISDVHQAAGLINDGKYYDASQLIKKAQDRERFDVASLTALPKVAAADAAKPAQNATAEKPAAATR